MIDFQLQTIILKRGFADCALASDVHLSDTGERLAKLETHVEFLIGNGQPGRLTKLEANVNELIRWKLKTVGWGIGVRSVVSAVVAFVYQIFK
jgi:hypothetical protein